MNHINTLHIAAAIITNSNNEILLVRKQNSPYFMQAGGKIEANETPSQALVRELQEELQLTTKQKDFNYIGEFLVPAANEANHIVKAHLFTITIADINLKPQAELVQVDWYSIKQAKTLLLAPLTKDIILPIIEKK